MIPVRLAVAAAVVSTLTGCCCCGSPKPRTDADIRILAGADPLVVKVDGKQEASLSAFSATSLSVTPGHHDVLLEAAGRPITAGVDVKVGDDVFLGGSDASCFAIVENPAGMNAKPRWDVDKDPIPTQWSLVHLLHPGEPWPEGDTLSHVADNANTINVSLSSRLAVPIACDATDQNAAITAGMTDVMSKVGKF